jgi:hypothetical protein
MDHEAKVKALKKIQPESWKALAEVSEANLRNNRYNRAGAYSNFNEWLREQYINALEAIVND